MILFLEGLPGVGKSTIIAHLRTRGIFCVDEVLDDKSDRIEDEISQSVFINSDNEKLRLATESTEPLIVLDRGPISTLAYNLTKHAIDPKHDSMPVIDWFSDVVDIYDRKDVKVLYLKGHSALPYNDSKDPYGSFENQQLLEDVTLDLVKIFVRDTQIKTYDYEHDFEELINEILN